MTAEERARDRKKVKIGPGPKECGCLEAKKKKGGGKESDSPRKPPEGMQPCYCTLILSETHFILLNN